MKYVDLKTYLIHMTDREAHLSTASLAVRKDADLVPVQGTLHQLRYLLKHLSLCGCWPKHLVKGEAALRAILRCQLQ